MKTFDVVIKTTYRVEGAKDMAHAIDYALTTSTLANDEYAGNVNVHPVDYETVEARKL